MNSGRGRGLRLVGLTAGACLAMAAALAPAGSADVTIGANVTQSTINSGTCGFESMAQRPCTFVTSTIPGQTMAAPCAGTVTRFRLNGFVRPANHYRLRVVRRNADGSFTGTASSAQVAIASEGVNEYATSLPIAAGEQIGIDFLDSTEEFGLRWVGSPGSVRPTSTHSRRMAGPLFPPAPPRSITSSTPTLPARLRIQVLGRCQRRATISRL